ncbi:serine hydrolase domain-containing protein [Brenneria corticis]|uniref:Serine hydrolase n=1 Tax=Brenneria corticis TaxID=2173106 RepID=A0A2U1UB88_9GAMM|nr:serine hydrolase domain-containing protein [Brenneria sp. CFCC 11842]PWC18935.1 serine hydrolase [Brenneria sp. CFCC 11842]
MYYFNLDVPSRPVGLQTAVDDVIDHAIAEQRLVGAVVLIAQHGTLLYRRAAGLADREHGAAMIDTAIFRLASITKPMVSTAAMRLIEEGRLNLDDDITRWLPNFRPRLEDGTEVRILVRHLLSHTSGLRYRYSAPKESAYHRLNVSDGVDQPGLSIEENLRRLAAAPLLYPPGEGYRYSLALDVLGAVMSGATGESLPELVRRLVTGPLGMDDTRFSVADLERLVTPYADGTPVPQPITDGTSVPFGEGTVVFAPSRILDPASYPSGGGGMAGTAPDFLQFLEAIRRGGLPLLSPESIQFMTRLQVSSQYATQGPGWGFGVGWAVLDHPAAADSPQSAGTISWSGVYGHTWFIDRARGLSVIALTNTTGEGVNGAFPKELRDTIYRELEEE